MEKVGNIKGFYQPGTCFSLSTKGRLDPGEVNLQQKAENYIKKAAHGSSKNNKNS